MRLLILKLIFLLSLSLAGLVYFISSTTAGLQFILAVTSATIPGHLAVSHVQGTLSDFTLDNLTYTYENDIYQFNKVRVAWQPFELVNKRAVINSIRIHEALINVKTSDDNTPIETAFLQPLRIHHLQSDKTVITVNDKPSGKFDNIDITCIDGNDYRVTGNVYEGNAAGTMHLEWSPVFKLTSTLAFSDINLNKVSQKLSGKLSFILQNSIHADQNMLSYDARMDELNGNLRQFPIRGFAAIHYKNGTLEIEPSEINIANGYARLAGRVSEEWKLNWDLNIPDFANLLPDLHGRLVTSGIITGPRARPVIEGKFNAAQFMAANVKASRVNGSIHMESGETSVIEMDANNIFINHYPVPSIRLRAVTQYFHRRLSSELVMSSSAHDELKGRLSAPRLDMRQIELTPIHGIFNFHFANLNALASTQDEIKNPKGDVNGRIELGGTIGGPELSVAAAITNGELTIPRLGITLKKITLNGQYSHHSITASGSFHSGKGVGNIQSTIQLSPALQAAIKLGGENLQFANLHEYKIFISPDIILAYQGGAISMNGKIVIPSASIAPVDLSATTTLSSDVVFVNAPASHAALPASLSIQTQLILGDAVKLDYENLHSRVKGTLSISQTPGRQPTAFGQLYLQDGTYNAYGKVLSIQNGRIIYTGNALFNPGLDISATRKIKVIAVSSASQFNNTGLQPTYAGTDTVTVGVYVKGTIKKPAITLFSSPAGMSQNNILSYLLFGYPQSELSGDNKLALLSAAASLKTGGSILGGFTDKIQNMTGLSELNVGSTQIFNPQTNSTQNATTLSVGKQISDKLSVHYSVGLYTSAALLNIRYQLSKRISLQTETSSLENGVDLLVGFERE